MAEVKYADRKQSKLVVLGKYKNNSFDAIGILAGHKWVACQFLANGLRWMYSGERFLRIPSRLSKQI